MLDAGTLDVYSEPLGDATIAGTMTPGDELIITDGPLRDHDVTWYRVQTLNFTGWIRNTENLSPAQ